ncbi:MAG: EVE domain-containing protein [Rhodobacteraceae bacterium]|nr:EVE domain-containing protein [Paracoccaceae bacterium]
MTYWLFKSEPDVWGWDKQVAEGDIGEEWDGIRSYQARNNMRLMKIGDRGFFYHSRKGLEIVGIVEVCALSHPDSTTDDERWDCVDIRAVQALPRPISMVEVKATPSLAKMVLAVNTRLSIQPVTGEEWDIINAMAATDRVDTV